MNNHKIRSFTDLECWKEGHKLVLLIYINSKKFPICEQFALTNQIQRSVVSITSNIAEGFGRLTWKDKQHFYILAMGSVAELQNQLLIARDVGYINNTVFQEMALQSVKVSKLLSGLIKSTKIKATES